MLKMLKLEIIEFRKTQQPLTSHVLDYTGEEAKVNAFVAFLISWKNLSFLRSITDSITELAKTLWLSFSDEVFSVQW